jgi:hypothetical protein
MAKKLPNAILPILGLNTRMQQFRDTRDSHIIRKLGSHIIRKLGSHIIRIAAQTEMELSSHRSGAREEGSSHGSHSSHR